MQIKSFKARNLVAACLIGVVLGQQFQADINKDLSKKLGASSPEYNTGIFSYLAKESGSAGSFHTADGTTAQLGEIKSRHLQIAHLKFYLFQEVAVLKWGNKLESLKSEVRMDVNMEQQS